MLQSVRLSRALTAKANPYPALETTIAFAKAAFEAGNDLAALDTKLFCKGLTKIPAWANVSIKPKDALQHAVAKGQGAHALTFVKIQNDHFECYAAAMTALIRDRVLPSENGGRDPVYVRAAELMAENGIYCHSDVVRRSCMRVKKDLLHGRGYKYWYPLSSQVLEHLPRREGFWQNNLQPQYKASTGWCFCYNPQ